MVDGIEGSARGQGEGGWRGNQSQRRGGGHWCLSVELVQGLVPSILVEQREIGDESAIKTSQL